MSLGQPLVMLIEVYMQLIRWFSMLGLPHLVMLSIKAGPSPSPYMFPFLGQPKRLVPVPIKHTCMIVTSEINQSNEGI